MGGLINEKCSACRRDSPRVTADDIRELKPQIPEWALVERDAIQRLERVFRFTDFAEALNFTNRVGALAEQGGAPSRHFDRVGPCDGHGVDAQDPRSSSQRLHHGGKARLFGSGRNVEALRAVQLFSWHSEAGEIDAFSQIYSRVQGKLA
jgi:hypothetical protein